MTEIYGRGKNWDPYKLVVTNSESNNGEYNFLDRGGGGIAYVNKDKNKVLLLYISLESGRDRHSGRLVTRLLPLSSRHHHQTLPCLLPAHQAPAGPLPLAQQTWQQTWQHTWHPVRLLIIQQIYLLDIYIHI